MQVWLWRVLCGLGVACLAAAIAVAVLCWDTAWWQQLEQQWSRHVGDRMDLIDSILRALSNKKDPSHLG